MLLKHFPADLGVRNGSRGYERAFREMLWASEASEPMHSLMFMSETPLLCSQTVAMTSLRSSIHLHIYQICARKNDMPGQGYKNF